MPTPLHVLIVEDSPDDTELLVAELQRSGFAPQWKRVESEQEFLAELKTLPQIVLSDYSLPQFDGLRAADLVRQSGLNIPFILISGTIGEDAAVEAMKRGASDYLLKDRIGRLGTAVQRALEHCHLERQRLNAEEKLRRADDTLRQMIAHSPAVIYTLRIEGESAVPVAVSENIERMTGFTVSECLRVGWWRESLHPEDCDRALAVLTRGLAGNGYSTEYRIHHKNGQWIWIADNSRVVRPAPSGSMEIAGVWTDITERKQAEEDRKKLEAQFLRAQRLEGIGALASGIAHDLNNILAPILMSAPMLRWGLKPEDLEKTLATLEASAKRGADLVKQLLTFGRGVEGQRVTLQPRHLVREIVSIARQTFPKLITARSDCAADLWPVVGDATQLHQVLLNLCVNARDAMPDGGTLTVSAQNTELDAHYAAMMPDAKAGPYVVLRVADNGTGMPAELLDKIFEPFFTTKGLGVGTGLGLSTVMGIVQSHGGFISVHSQPGQGSTFAVYLPAAPGCHVEDENAPPSAPPGKGQLILVVDDEPAITEVCRKALERSGYRVLTAADGVEALLLYSRQSAEIQAVVTDLEMPFLDGVGLVRAIKRLNSDALIVIATGVDSHDGRNEKIARVREEGVARFLTKPFNSNTLLAALSDLFRQP